MKELLDKINDLAAKSEELNVSETERTNYLELVRKFANQYINELPDLDAFVNKKVNVNPLKIGGEKHKLEDLLSVFRNEVNETGLRAASGGHIGYIPGGGIYTAALGDFLAAVSNEYAGVSYASPGAVAIENEVINWLKELFGFPASAVGNLASGGSLSNLIALTSARDKYQVKNEKIKESVIYLSSQAHHCIMKAIKIIGLEDVIIRHVPLDEEFRMNAAALQIQIAEDKSSGLNPFLVIASAGTTDVGAIDPLDDIATIAHDNKLWLHVDAAYGGFFMLTSKKDRFKGIEKADSLVVDPHKGLFLPYGIGAVLIKDADAVLHAHSYSANYMQDTLQSALAESPANVSPELTKHFRGMRIWLPLKLHGIAPFVACLEEKLVLTEYFRNCLQQLGCKVGPQPDLSVSYFWFPSGGDENRFNQKLMELMHEDGRVFFSSTLLNDKFVIRIAILSFRTKKNTLDKAIDMIADCIELTKSFFMSNAIKN